MAGPEPHISIVIPTFNRARFIQDAVDSCYIGNVASSMVEVIVVDNGSTDDTSAILEEMGDRCRHVRLGANQGRNRARNIGKSMATGRYVKFLDSDDVLLQGSLAVELAAADDSGADPVVSGWVSVTLAAQSVARSTRPFAAPMMDPVIDSLLPDVRCQRRRLSMHESWSLTQPG